MAAELPVLDPRLLGATRGLALTAQQLVAGTIAGLHASRRTGVAREFSQYRAYQPGDEPRHIDWKLFARSDRYYLRESEVDTRVAISLVLDATGSMAHRGAAPDEPRKFDLARQLAAALAFLAEGQGDVVTLHTIADGAVRSHAAGGRRQAFQRIVHALSALEPHGRWPENVAALPDALRRSELEGGSAPAGAAARLTVLLSDGHQQGDEMRAAFAALRTRRHELVFFHFIAPDERDFPYRGATRFEEWETGRVIEADAQAVRAAYLAHEERERAAWSRAWGGERFDCVTLATDEPLEHALRTYLRRRMAR